MKKRIIELVLCVVLCIGLVFACNGGNNKNDAGCCGSVIDGSSRNDAKNDGCGDGCKDASDDVGTPVHPFPVNLGASGNFAILAESGISTVPTSVVVGNIGVSPAAASYITGFSLVADATNVFATSPQVAGKIFAADYASPTPSNMTAAISDMHTAFTDAASRAPAVTELGAGDVSGMTLYPGVYKWGTGLLISTNIILSGNSSDVWVFEIAQDLTVANGAKVLLVRGARAKNIFWQVSGKVELGTTSHFEGDVLCQTEINMRTGATINGRLLAQTAVNIDSSAVTKP